MCNYEYVIRIEPRTFNSGQDKLGKTYKICEEHRAVSWSI